MFVPGGEIRVDKEFLRFIPKKGNIFLPADSDIPMEEISSLHLKISVNSFTVFLIRKALISAFAGLEMSPISFAGCIISLAPNRRGVKIRLFNEDERKGSSFIIPHTRVIPLFQALRPSARYVEEIYSPGQATVLRLTPDIDQLLMSEGSQTQNFDLSGIFLLREVLLKVLTKKTLNVSFREGNFELTSSENATDLKDVVISFGKFKARLTKPILVSILSVC